MTALSRLLLDDDKIQHLCHRQRLLVSLFFAALVEYIVRGSRFIKP